MLLGRCMVSTFTKLPRRPSLVGHQLFLHTSGNAWLQQSVPAQKSPTVEPLAERSFIRVHGADSASFLQGLMTNDMRHFEHCGAMYAMFLKANGRIFCDALIYKRPGKEVADDYLLECDSSVASRLEKHLKLYRLKKKVQVTPDETFRLWVAFRDDGAPESVAQSDEMAFGQSPPEDGENVYLFKDPRLTRLGYRVLSSNDQAGTVKQLSKIFPEATMMSGDGSTLPYTTYRYSLGVGEGMGNLPEGKCFPLECNCDYLHGVSFHKGCYIGQELTARTYHTGVIRKRLMPLKFDAPPMVNVQQEALLDAEIKNQDGAVVGKLRGVVGNLGLGLLRIEKVLPSGLLSLSVPGVADPIPCRTYQPGWWPKETITHH